MDCSAAWEAVWRSSEYAWFRRHIRSGLYSRRIGVQTTGFHKIAGSRDGARKKRRFPSLLYTSELRTVRTKRLRAESSGLQPDQARFKA
jgi:hypothetical protein